MKRLLLAGAVLASVLFSAPAEARPFTITFDPGGSVVEFYEKYNMLRQTGAEVMVDGPCISACTLVFGLIDADKVCITSRALFGFHSASKGDEFAQDITQMIWLQYPEYVRQFLLSKGWDGTTAHPDLIWMDNQTALGFFKPCTQEPNN